MVEENSRLTRAMAALLVSLAAVTGCTVNRAGLGGAEDGSSPADAQADAPTGNDRAPDAGQATGGSNGAGGGGGGVGGRGGGAATGGAPGDDAGLGGSIARDAGDGAGPIDRPVDQIADHPGLDTPSDVPVCGASALCDSGTVPVTLPGGRFTGTTAGGSTDQGTCGGDRAPEAVFRLVLTETSDVFATTHGTAFDTVLYLRSGCCGAEIACNDDADNRKTSMLAVRGLAAGTYDIFVDGKNQNQAGPFTLDIYAGPSAPLAADSCGNPVRIAGAGITGTTCGMADDFSPLPGCLVAPATTSFDTVYYFVLDAPATVVAFNTCTNTCIDTVLAIRDVCTTPNTQRACNDNFCAPALGTCPGPALPTQSRATATLPAGIHYLILDTHVIAGPTGCGPYTITPVGVPE